MKFHVWNFWLSTTRECASFYSLPSPSLELFTWLPCFLPATSSSIYFSPRQLSNMPALSREKLEKNFSRKENNVLPTLRHVLSYLNFQFDLMEANVAALYLARILNSTRHTCNVIIIDIYFKESVLSRSWLHWQSFHLLHCRKVLFTTMWALLSHSHHKIDFIFPSKSFPNLIVNFLVHISHVIWCQERERVSRRDSEIKTWFNPISNEIRDNYN